ncbi:MAG: hypothetical protein WC872_02095 [Candidatus Absconditabacterales bacterium]
MTNSEWQEDKKFEQYLIYKQKIKSDYSGSIVKILLGKLKKLYTANKDLADVLRQPNLA